MLGVDHLDVVRQVWMSARRDRARAVLAQREEDVVAVVQLEDDALEVEHAGRRRLRCTPSIGGVLVERRRRWCTSVGA
jgi:hypothetical protein